MNIQNNIDIDTPPCCDLSVAEYLLEQMDELINILQIWADNDSLSEILDPISEHPSGANWMCRIDGMIVYMKKGEETLVIVAIERDIENSHAA